jgi:hypothetical protein
MTLNELTAKAYERAVKSGWWTEEKHSSVYHMLMVTEIAEATESCRKKEPHFFFGEDGKPDGESVELADVVIRIADYFGHKGWDLDHIVNVKMRYNEIRPHKHGDKAF